jgi:hypothetical protein
MIKKICIGLHVKYTLFLLYFSETRIFLTYCRKNRQVSNSMKIHPVGAELFHAGGLTDVTKLIVALRNLAKAPHQWRRQRTLQQNRTLKFFVKAFGLESVLLTEGSIVDPCCNVRVQRHQ